MKEEKGESGALKENFNVMLRQLSKLVEVIRRELNTL